MSIDRMLAVTFPMNAKSLCTVKRAITTVIGTSVVIPGVNIHLFFVVEVMQDYELGTYGRLVFVTT